MRTRKLISIYNLDNNKQIGIQMGIKLREQYFENKKENLSVQAQRMVQARRAGMPAIASTNNQSVLKADSGSEWVE
jgi:hypothetical protein